MATTVRITETYDLKTTINTLGIIGIHTPDKALIKKLYPGLIKNHKYIRLQRCDITGVCASVLPADPMQVGVESGDVAPEDMFNPILYKPVSNESFETIQNRIYAGNDVIGAGSLAVQTVSGSPSPFDVYYALLSESKKWKKAMPQNGFGLRGLYPICYQMINTFGNQFPLGTNGLDNNLDDLRNVIDDESVNVPSGDLSGVARTTLAMTFRGKSVKMPKFPLHQTSELGFSPTPSNVSIGDFVIPKTYVAMFIIPPARLHEFYYRMRVSWVITFSGVCSTLEVGRATTFSRVASDVHGQDFSYGSKETTPLQNEASLVDANDVTISKIMES